MSEYYDSVGNSPDELMFNSPIASDSEEASCIEVPTRSLSVISIESDDVYEHDEPMWSPSLISIDSDGTSNYDPMSHSPSTMSLDEMHLEFDDPSQFGKCVNKTKKKKYRSVCLLRFFFSFLCSTISVAFSKFI